ncbi:hypothetical protein LCGC14_1458190 [marine sediment metagenome]|uniref:HTH cro/C1-type domain-containing protein n=1 Tax=marine sediment metagenome TaxID=412755 RepID=A0A0F9JFT9_9ZZZZ
MKITCPECKGEGEISGIGCPGFVPIVLPCRLCGGTKEEKGEGQVLQSLYERYIGARSLRDKRVSCGVSLREMAKQIGVRPSRVSDIERGYVNVTLAEEAAYRYLGEAYVGRSEEMNPL